MEGAQVICIPGLEMSNDGAKDSGKICPTTLLVRYVTNVPGHVQHCNE